MFLIFFKYIFLFTAYRRKAYNITPQKELKIPPWHLPVIEWGHERLSVVFLVDLPVPGGGCECVRCQVKHWCRITNNKAAAHLTLYRR